MKRGNKKRFVGYLLVFVGFLTYFATVSLIMGYDFGLLKVLQGFLVYYPVNYVMAVLSLLLISLSTVFLVYEDHKKLSNFGGFLFLISLLLYVVNVIASGSQRFQVLVDAILLSSIVLIVVSASIRNVAFKSIYGPRDIGSVDNSIYKTGTAFKAFSSALAIFWVIDKLITLPIVQQIFITSEYLLMTSFVSYIVGSAVESYGGTSPISGAFSAIKSGLTSAFGTSLILVILSYILMALNLVSGQWHQLHDKLVYTTLVLLAGVIIAHLMMPEGEFTHLLKEVKKVGKIGDLFVARKNGELDISDDLSILVESGSIVSRLEFENDEKFNGVYILGYGFYNVKTPFGKISGSFDKLWLIGKEDYWQEIDESLSLGHAGYVNLEEFGFLSKEAFFDFIKDEKDRIIELLRKTKKQATYIKLPFLEIYEGGDKEYVKIGPLTILESGESTYISIGPFKIIDEGATHIKNIRGKKEPRVIIGINDRDRGELILKVYDTHVEILTGEEKISTSKSSLNISRGGTKVSYSEREIKIVRENLTLKAKKGEYAKFISGSNIIKAQASGDIKIIKGGKILKINDPELASKIIDKIYKTGLSLIEKRFKVDQKDEVHDLLSYLDKLIND